jgi:hypothetical protein
VVTKADLEKLKIDVVDELQKVRRKHANTPSEEIEKATTTLVEIKKRRTK